MRLEKTNAHRCLRKIRVYCRNAELVRRFFINQTAGAGMSMQLFSSIVRTVAATALAAGVACAHAQAPAPKPHVQILQMNSICSSGREAGEALVDDPRVALISATGSTRGERRFFGRLPDHRVAAYQRQGGIPCPNRYRKIEGADHAHHTQRVPALVCGKSVLSGGLASAWRST